MAPVHVVRVEAQVAAECQLLLLLEVRGEGRGGGGQGAAAPHVQVGGHQAELPCTHHLQSAAHERWGACRRIRHESCEFPVNAGTVWSSSSDMIVTGNGGGTPPFVQRNGPWGGGGGGCNGGWDAMASRTLPTHSLTYSFHTHCEPGLRPPSSNSVPARLVNECITWEKALQRHTPFPRSPHAWRALRRSL